MGGSLEYFKINARGGVEAGGDLGDLGARSLLNSISCILRRDLRVLKVIKYHIKYEKDNTF